MHDVAWVAGVPGLAAAASLEAAAAEKTPPSSREAASASMTPSSREAAAALNLVKQTAVARTPTPKQKVPHLLPGGLQIFSCNHWATW